MAILSVLLLFCHVLWPTCLSIALFGAGRVRRYRPDGSPDVRNVCISMVRGRLTAAAGAGQARWPGGLIVCRPGLGDCPSNLFKGA